jgi:hypothetical protein
MQVPEDDWIPTFSGWCGEMARIASQSGALRLATELCGWRASCAMGLADDEACLAYMQMVAETPLPLLDQDFLKRLMACAVCYCLLLV